MNRHNAPPVTYPLGRSYFLGGLLLALWLAGLLLALVWDALTQASGWRLSASCSAVLLAGLAAGLSWKNLPRGQLAWDGEVWRWESECRHSAMAEHELSVVADFQRCLLLRLESQAGASLWLWAEQPSLPERWLDLRRAVYSPHRSCGALPAHDLLSGGLSPAVAAGDRAVAVSTAMRPVQATRAKP